MSVFVFLFSFDVDFFFLNFVISYDGIFAEAIRTWLLKIANDWFIGQFDRIICCEIRLKYKGNRKKILFRIR